MLIEKRLQTTQGLPSVSGSNFGIWLHASSFVLSCSWFLLHSQSQQVPLAFPLILSGHCMFSDYGLSNIALSLFLSQHRAAITRAAYSSLTCLYRYCPPTFTSLPCHLFSNQALSQYVAALPQGSIRIIAIAPGLAPTLSLQHLLAPSYCISYQVLSPTCALHTIAYPVFSLPTWVHKHILYHLQ